MTQPATPTGKEFEKVPSLTKKEMAKYGVVEQGIEEEFEPRVKDWLEKLETGGEIQIPQVVSDDGRNQPVVVSSPIVEIELPLTHAQVNAGLHNQLGESIRWLAEWCVRMIKMYHGRVRYAPA